jgi:hypothetical protein
MLVCVGVLNSFPFAFALLSCALQLGGLAHSEGSWSEAQQYYEQVRFRFCDVEMSELAGGFRI